MEQKTTTGIMPDSEMYYDLDAFIRAYDGKTPVIIFGTGKYGEFIVKKLTAAGIRVECFTCNSAVRYGSKYCNIDVKAPSCLTGHDAFVIIAVIDAYSKRDVLHQVLEAGVKRERIITPIEPLGVFYDKKLIEVPEFAEAERKITLARIQKERDYFCDYFVTNELTCLAMLEKDELSQIAEELLSDMDVEIRYIKESDGFDGFDAIVLTDRENFIFLEERLMDRMGEAHIPVVNFWTVVKQS